MQHGRAGSALSVRGIAGRGRVMSILKALSLFAAIALAIPGLRTEEHTSELQSPNHICYSGISV